jgi:hypothetical protein
MIFSLSSLLNELIKFCWMNEFLPVFSIPAPGCNFASYGAQSSSSLPGPGQAWDTLGPVLGPIGHTHFEEPMQHAISCTSCYFTNNPHTVNLAPAQSHIWHMLCKICFTIIPLFASLEAYLAHHVSKKMLRHIWHM